MGSVKLKLRQGTGTSQNIYIHFNYGRKKQYRYATGFSIKKAAHWDKQNNAVKNVLAEPDSSNINADLAELLTFSRQMLRDLEKGDIPFDNRIIKERLIKWNSKNGGKQEVKYLTDHYKWFVEYYKSKPRPSTGRPLAESTLKPYKNTLRILKDYEKHLGGRLAFQHINLPFHSEFIQWLQDKEYTDNYIGTQIKNIKTVMHDAVERGLHKNLDYQKSAFTKPKEEVNHIYLTMSEIKRIKEINYSKQLHLDVARDLFVIAAVTGLRVSDYKSLSTSNIKSYKGIRFLEVKTQKTGKIVHIPLHPYIQEILEKRNGQFPMMIPEQKINEALKSIGRKAKLNDEVVIERTEGGSRTRTTFKKHQLLTNHTARRSFCTNAYKADMPVIDIMAISGHTSEKVFYSYIKASPMERLEKISKHVFFS
ncbi:site-specific integrase [Salinimicrobium terrae]|uniref:site-specific integrase n=1 Tax=Salinimicrobium terrae TaxID=470866 RepID=UPI0004157254|nr:site-specific integrase [Salinimicrobium terrae]